MREHMFGVLAAAICLVIALLVSTAVPVYAQRGGGGGGGGSHGGGGGGGAPSGGWHGGGGGGGWHGGGGSWHGGGWHGGWHGGWGWRGGWGWGWGGPSVVIGAPYWGYPYGYPYAYPYGYPASATIPDRLAPHRDQIAAWLAEGLRLTKIHRRLQAQGVPSRTARCIGSPSAQLGFGAPTHHRPRGRAAAGRGRRSRFRPARALARSRRERSAGACTACWSPCASAATRSSAITLRQDLAAVLDGLESRLDVLRRRRPAPRRRQSQARRHPPRSLHARASTACSSSTRSIRGFVVDPAVVRHATGKPKVERGVPYCRQDFFRGETFRDLADMQTRAVAWCRDIAGTRVHGTTRQVPRVVFETRRAPDAAAAGPEPFDRPTWAGATVHPDHHIQFRRALYSVPTRYLRPARRGPRRFAASCASTTTAS